MMILYQNPGRYVWTFSLLSAASLSAAKEASFGGNGDGFATSTLSSTTLTGQSLEALYDGSNGDGFDVDDALSKTLTNASIQVLYGGNGNGNGDGFDVDDALSKTLTNASIQVLYGGNGSGNGDGFSINTLANTTLTNQSLTVLFEGSNGDGFDVEPLTNTTLTNQSLTILFEGSNGDGFDSLQVNGLALEPPPNNDTDGDLMPNDWENLYGFLNPNNPNDADLDFDGDGVSNLDEYYADTLPNSASSFFCIDIRPDGLGNYEVFYNTSAARYYRIQTGDDLTGWNFTGPSIFGTGGEMSQPIPAGSENFARILVAPTPID